MKRLLPVLSLTLLLPLLFTPAARAALVEKPVDYRAGDTVMKGFLVYDGARRGKRPGVLVVHEWWGLNDYARERARMLARLGYVALAVDMYGDGKQASHPDDAGKFSAAIAKNMPLAKARFEAALQVLQREPHSDARHIAAIGYCFGGGVVLNMARQGLDLDGVVSFHGSLAPTEPAQPGAIRARILVEHGGADPFTSGEQLLAFIDEMNRAGADYRLVVLGGAMHSFTNPDADAYGKRFDLPLRYNREADEASWDDMKRFLAEVFR